MHALGLIQMGRMGEKLMGTEWRKKGSDHNGYLSFFWVNWMEKKNTMYIGVHA